MYLLQRCKYKKFFTFFHGKKSKILLSDCDQVEMLQWPKHYRNLKQNNVVRRVGLKGNGNKNLVRLI